MEQNGHSRLRGRGNRRHVPRSVWRRIVGWTLISLALLGFALPVLPGVPFLALGIVFLGPHDPTLRRVAVALRLLLRRWSQVRQRHVRRVGILARSQYRASRLALRARLHAHERGEQGWQGHLKLLTVMLLGVAISASLMFVAWRVIP